MIEVHRTGPDFSRLLLTCVWDLLISRCATPQSFLNEEAFRRPRREISVPLRMVDHIEGGLTPYWLLVLLHASGLRKALEEGVKNKSGYFAEPENVR